MKYYKKAGWVFLFIFIVLLVFVAVAFRVDDMTLSKGTVYDWNEGWELVRAGGESMALEELPYLGKSEPGEVVYMENTVPEDYRGLTMSFLSADKTLKVWIDGEPIYEFGRGDQRLFGHTPGSVVNFIDLPADMKEGKIRIEMASPYNDYAARLSRVTVGKRDVLILKLLKDNLFSITCNLVIIICGIIFFLLWLIQLISHQDAAGMQYLCGYCISTSLYYCVETKCLHIFYGNETLYSVLVFLCIMMISFFICMYYADGMLGIYKKRFNILLGAICANIVIQLILQIFNIVDFMNMVFVSHILILLGVFVVSTSYLQYQKEKGDRSVKLDMLALFFMGGGGILDIVRMYVIAVGDMGKFSRFGTTFYCIIMLYQHFNRVQKGYAYSIEENARLLKHEVEYVEKKNEQLKKASELAEEARREALEANAAKGKFLAHMSHEIRTPINAVLGMDTMILRETKEMQIKEYALDIQNAGQNLLGLINDILDLSKIELGKLEIIDAEYDLCSMIHDITNMISAKAEAKKLKLAIHVEEDLPSKLFGDEVRIRQVLVNLLNNAVKYTHKGSVSLCITGKVDEGVAFVDFMVEDTGIGIKKEDLSRLFAEFERIEEKRNRNIEGTGLGMSITTQLLQLMGSKLNVESTYGEGSRFFFTLRQPIVDSTPVGNLEERIRKQSAEYNYVNTFTAPNAQILVVDDNAINLKVFVSLLKSVKVNVDVADSGKACLEMIALKHYDVIFLDHMMPEMDGIETLHRMKELNESQCRFTPVVALTANAITGAKEMYLSEGFDAFLPKPINPEKLEQMILKLLPREYLNFDVEDGETETVTDKDTVLDTEYEEGDKTDTEEFPIIDGMDLYYGLMHLPDRELLMGTITDFYKTLEAEAGSLDQFYEESRNDPAALEKYRVKVHSMKSSANLIGAITLGGMAKILENAAREGDTERINALHDIFLKEWRSYKEKLAQLVEAEGKEEGKSGKEAVKAEDSEILAYLEILRNAFWEMDIDAMDETMKTLESFSYPEGMASYIEQLSVSVINMDFEQSTELIEELEQQIKSNKG